MFLYSDRQLVDIEQFCCKKDDNVPLGVDTTFNLCELWLTDTSYRNKRLVRESSGAAPVFLGPCMFHFKKDEEAFSRFALEMRIGNSALKELKAIGVDMESAIFNGFKIHNSGLSRLVCVRHLKKRDEEKIGKLLAKTNQTAAQKKHSKAEILNDMYGQRSGTAYEYGLAESLDCDDFTAKLLSLQDKWESLVPGFYSWFITNRKVLFIESVIQSARDGTNIQGLYYQNDVESQHAVEKCIQHYKKEDVLVVINNLQRLSDRQDAEEVRALYGAGNYRLAESYRKFLVKSSEWHNWSEKRRHDHVSKFREYVPTMSDSFTKPRNSGKKPSDRQSQRTIEPDVIIDRLSTANESIQDSNDSIRFPDPR